ncbi:putative at hook domain-containing protein [Erysiphe neolycopersici]|uniref:Putative at hook domain-containing protein n=1 Tax=Erysiphe neolycopersici TaxID=212602 RepID=A0A420HK24_9PEZI|nr:putative at hook domain-containing protein [Erysiphe neolycopersici]
MASRQERMQQRLRGVLRREIRDVDFGLTFPTTLKGESQPRQHPPEPTLTPQKVLTQVDIIKDPEVSPSIVLRNQVSLVQNTDAAEGSGEHFNPARSANANTSKKRRTLDKKDINSISSQSPRKSQEKNDSHNSQRFRDDFISNTLPVHTLPDESNKSISKVSYGKDKSYGGLPYLKAPKLGRTPRRSQGIQVVTESPTNAPGSGQRVQLNQPFSQDVTLPTGHSNSRKRANNTTPSLPPKRRKERSRDETQSSSLTEEEKSTILNYQNDDHDDNELDELSPDRSLLQDPRVGRQSSELRNSSVGIGRQNDANTTDDVSAANILSMYQKQRYGSSRHESPDLDLPSTEPARKKQRQSKRRSFIDSPLVNKNSFPKIRTKGNKKKNSKTRSKSSIPITVHRLTTPINFEDGYGERNSAEIFNTRKSHVTRKDVNWIDILIKACEEIIGTRTSALKYRVDECEDIATRREFKTKWQAIKLFGKELQDQLLEFTLDLDNAHFLERRLREEQKKKLHLREEILRIRAEREKVAVKIDEIREQHSKAEEKSLSHANLNNAIHNLELTMDTARDGLRDGDSPSLYSINSRNQYRHDNSTLNLAGTQVLLKSIAHLVTGQRNSSIGGLLTQVKDFNLFLERAAIVLERRREE